jgi:hypothetical protein
MYMPFKCMATVCRKAFSVTTVELLLAFRWRLRSAASQQLDNTVRAISFQLTGV